MRKGLENIPILLFFSSRLWGKTQWLPSFFTPPTTSWTVAINLTVDRRFWCRSNKIPFLEQTRNNYHFTWVCVFFFFVFLLFRFYLNINLMIFDLQSVPGSRWPASFKGNIQSIPNQYWNTSKTNAEFKKTAMEQLWRTFIIDLFVFLGDKAKCWHDYFRSNVLHLI